MKISLQIAVLIAICLTSGAYADHRHGPRNECWCCPTELNPKCIEAVSMVNKMGKTGVDRLQEIKNLAAFTDTGVDIFTACHLE